MALEGYEPILTIVATAVALFIMAGDWVRTT